MIEPSMEEAKLYRTLFAGDPPPVICERFRRASTMLDGSVPPAELRAYRNVIEQVRDLEALEIACRYTRRLPLLSRKLQLMVYLAETLPENQFHFINDRDGLVLGLRRVLAAGFRSVWKLASGLSLLRHLPDA